jgi:pyruvate dehydrogenase E2 component (dihydrolipoamide acetyltransferase)
MEEGTLLEWLVKPGDAVQRGDVIAVVDTDKAAIEVECFADGVIEELIVTPGQKVPVGTVLATLGGAGAALKPAPPGAEAAAVKPAPPAAEAATVKPAPAPVAAALRPAPAPVAAALRPAPAPVAAALRPAPAPKVPAPPPIPPPTLPDGVVPAPNGGGRVTSPLVRHLAETRGLDLTRVAGSGPGGVVHRADLEPPPVAAPARGGRLRVTPFARRLAAQAGLDLAAVSGTGTDGAITAADVRRSLERPEPRPAAVPVAPAAAPAHVDDHGDAMRQAIAALMTRSNREIPHYYLTSTIDMTVVQAWLHDRNRDLPVAERLVPAAALLVATARAAAAVHELNGHWIDDAFCPAETVDLGLVISLRRGGILVPVIKNAPDLSVDAMMAAIRGVVERARTGRLRSSEMSQPSITVSNLGDQGVESVLGVIYPPQVALVGFGAVVERPWAVDGLLGVRPVVTATLAADHRASDGAIGARLLNRVDRLLQKPEEL